MTEKPQAICPQCGAEIHRYIPVLRPIALQLHPADELMYSRDGYHWYYKGEDPIFDLMCPACAEKTRNV